jgi:hypothetical protein
LEDAVGEPGSDADYFDHDIGPSLYAIDPERENMRILSQEEGTLSE